MKPFTRRMPIPQYEFGFVPQTFSLFQQQSLDGERIARERDAIEQARRIADAAQTKLFSNRTRQPMKARRTGKEVL